MYVSAEASLRWPAVWQTVNNEHIILYKRRCIIVFLHTKEILVPLYEKAPFIALFKL